jgi:hypothetical protein
MRVLKHASVALGAVALSLAGSAGAARAAVAVHVQRKLTARQNVHVTFRAPPLRARGYYYAVLVLKPYKHYTRSSPPPCATSSDMQRADYGYPRGGRVALALAPAKSPARQWCRGGAYSGAIYAVPHPPPCNSAYPCYSEPYREPCAGIRPGCVVGVIPLPQKWAYPDGPPRPRASDTTIVGRFSVKFPS